MSKLFVNGCSISLGAELGEETRYFDENQGTRLEPYQWVNTPYRKQHRWSSKLAERMNLDCVNISRGAGSNWRTWRSTLDFFNRPENLDFEGFAAIQLSGPERFQIPINDRFISEWQFIYPCEECDGVRGHHSDGDFNEWAKGGVYSPDDDDLDPVLEEYSHWNAGSLSLLGTDDIYARHFVGMEDKIRAHTAYTNPVSHALDTLRLIESLVYFFRSKRIPVIIWDGLDCLKLAERVLEGLEYIQHSPTVSYMIKNIREGNDYKKIIDLFSDPDFFWHTDKRVKERYFLFLREAKMYDKMYNKLQSVKNMREVSRRPFWNLYRKGHPEFVGSMKNGHPNEECHDRIASLLYDEITEKKLWSLR